MRSFRAPKLLAWMSLWRTVLFHCYEWRYSVSTEENSWTKLAWLSRPCIKDISIWRKEALVTQLCLICFRYLTYHPPKGCIWWTREKVSNFVSLPDRSTTRLVLEIFFYTKATAYLRNTNRYAAPRRRERQDTLEYSVSEDLIHNMQCFTTWWRYVFGHFDEC